MSLGYFANLADAKAYFTNERLIETAWNALATDALKTKAVKNAYNRIYHDPRYAVPTYAAATAAQLVVLKIVNGEMAYFLSQHLEDEDRRVGIRAQGVTKAGIVEEEYKDLLELPIPPFVDALLADAGFVTAKAFGMVNLDRDEDKSVDEKIDDF